MKIVNFSENDKLSTKQKVELELLFSKLESASFADECRYNIKDFQRQFCCTFIRNEQYSKACCWHVKDLSMLANNINILVNKSKEIDDVSQNLYSSILKADNLFNY